MAAQRSPFVCLSVVAVLVTASLVAKANGCIHTSSIATVKVIPLKEYVKYAMWGLPSERQIHTTFYLHHGRT